MNNITMNSKYASTGSHTQWYLKIDGRLARSLISIQAIKAVEFGLGVKLAKALGSAVHDEIFYSKEKFGADSLNDIKNNFNSYNKRLKAL